MFFLFAPLRPCVFALEQRLLYRLPCLRRQPSYLAPRRHQAVVRQRLGAPALALADGVEAVRQVARDVAQAADLGQQAGRGRLAPLLHRPDELLRRLPDGEARVGAGVAGSTLTVSGVIDSGTNNYGLAVRSATSSDVVVLSGANTYLGATQSVVGILRLGANNTLPVGTVLQIGNTSNVDTATVDLNGFNQTVGGLESLGTTMTRTLTNTSGTASTLTINSLSDRTYGQRR